MRLDSGVCVGVVSVVARGGNVYVRCVLDAMKMFCAERLENTAQPRCRVSLGQRSG